MDRRSFLKSLAALGGAIALPAGSIASAPEEIIEAAWRSALVEPVTFYVNEYGTISYSATAEYPISRLALFNLDYLSGREGLISAANEDWKIANIIEDAMITAAGDDQEQSWEDWLAQADDDTVNELVCDINAYLDDCPDESDWERADLAGYSDRGAALSFFRDEFECNDLFEIAIVEGEHPGSSYYAAELRIDIDTANAIAQREGIPIRFDWGEA